MELFGSGKKYDEIKYFGDGSNDLHPVMALSETDTVFPRKDFKLADLISNGENKIKADVCPWRDGSDILEVCRNEFGIFQPICLISRKKKILSTFFQPNVVNVLGIS